MAETTILVEDVSMVFSTRDGDVHALDRVTFAAREGEFFSILGPSGCGKSTLLRIIGGLLRPTDGRVAVNGSRVTGPTPDVGIVFQSPVLMNWRTVLENVMLQAEVRHLNLKEYRERAMGLLEMVGLAGFEEKYPYQLSGGMQQRAAIARSLVHDPRLILMDEPFGALDALTRERMNLELLRIWEQSRKTILFVTHGIAEAVFLGTRVVVLTAGPARMADRIDIDLPRPRTLDMKTHERFGSYARRIYHLLGVE